MAFLFVDEDRLLLMCYLERNVKTVRFFKARSIAREVGICAPRVGRAMHYLIGTQDVFDVGAWNKCGKNTTWMVVRKCNPCETATTAAIGQV